MTANSRIAKNSLILYIRLIVVLFIGILSSRFILQALGASDFGLFNVVGGIVSIMAVLNNVLVSTTYRYIAIELGTGAEDAVNKVYNISLVIHIILATIVFLLSETIGVFYIKHYLVISNGKLDDALFVFRLSILSTVLSILSVPSQGLIFAKEKFSVTAIVEIFRSSLALIVTILVLFYSGNKLRFYAGLITIISILPSILYFLYSRYQFSSLTKWNFQKEKEKYKGIVSYSGWLMFGAAASVGEIQGSVIIINLFFGTLVNAGYGIANQVNNLVKMFAQSLNQATIPQITTSYSGGNMERNMQLVVFSSKYAFFLLLIPSLPILLETEFILKLWLKEVPEYTVIFIQIMIINALISTMNSGIYAAIQASGEIKYFQIILGAFTLSGLPISFILFKYGLPVYVSLLVYSVLYIVNFFVIHILAKRILQFNTREFFNNAVSKMVKVFITITPLFLVTKVFESSIQLFIGISIFSFIWLLVSIYVFGMDNKERGIVINFLGKLIFRLNQKQVE